MRACFGSRLWTSTIWVDLRPLGNQNTCHRSMPRRGSDDQPVVGGIQRGRDGGVVMQRRD